MNEEQLKAMFEQLGKANEEFKSAHKKELEEIKAKGSASTETAGKVEKINDAISSLEEEIKHMKVAMNRTSQGNSTSEKSAYAKELTSYLRKGNSVNIETMRNEFKEMSVMIDEDGGFLVTPEMSSEIITKVFESSPMRQLASVQNISSDSLEMLNDLEEIESGWVGEKQARPVTDTAKLKMIKIPVHELYAQPSATQKILDDASINVESWLAGKAAEKFVRDEATAFVNGDGSGKPKGFLSYGAGDGFGLVQQITTAASNVLAADDMIEICYALKGAYKSNAAWAMQRNTAKLLRKFKDLDGQYLWQPGLNGASQSTFLGHAIYEFNDMPAMTGTDNSKLPIAFGDFRQGYQIVDRTGVRVLRDPYSNKPFVLFYFTKRVGGAVKNFEAIKLLKIKA